MRKIFSFLLMAVLNVVSTNAQSADTAFAAVHYTFLYVADTTKPAEVMSENMILYLGKNVSEFVSYNKVLSDSIMAEELKRSQAVINSGGPISVRGSGIKIGYYDIFYKDVKLGKLTRSEKLIREYLIEEDMPQINWTITQEQKDIQGLLCQKAAANFRGRNYTAWFCSQLPYNNGPWKLGGLPGLIVEAADDKNEVVYRFAGYEDVTDKHIAISFSTRAIKATPKEFKLLREASEKDPRAFIMNTTSTIKLAVPDSYISRVIQRASKNPIERTPN